MNPVGNFENALRYAKGDYIFPADQDIYGYDRVEKISILDSDNTECVICNRIIIDGERNIEGRYVVKENFTRYPFKKLYYTIPTSAVTWFLQKHTWN